MTVCTFVVEHRSHQSAEIGVTVESGTEDTVARTMLHQVIAVGCVPDIDSSGVDEVDAEGRAAEPPRSAAPQATREAIGERQRR